MKSQSLFGGSARGGLLSGGGGWFPIKDVNEAHVKEMGEFAVDEHNKVTNAALMFESVISGETQLVAGIKYYLIVAAKDGTVSKNYGAHVYERPWENIRSLTCFNLL